jgi:hypothetical protein
MSGSLYSIHFRHLGIHQDYNRVKFVGFGYGIQSVHSLPYYLEVGVGAKDAA